MRREQVDAQIASTEMCKDRSSPDGIEAGVDHDLAAKRIGRVLGFPDDPATSSQGAA